MKKSLIDVLSVRDEDEDGRKCTKVVYIENHVDDEGNVTKKHRIEEKPMYSFYVSKEGKVPEIGVNYVRVEDVDKHVVPFDLLDRKCAELTGQKKFFQACIDNRKFRSLKRIHAHTALHLSDMDLRDFKIREWLERTPPEKMAVIPLRKAFYDIEVDGIKHQGFPDASEAPCPVAMISYLHQPTMEVHSFILANEENHSQQLFFEKLGEIGEEAWLQQIMDEMNEEAYTEDGKLDENQVIRKVHLHVYDDELDLIRSFFKLVHRDKADYLSAWNGGFDCVTLANRIRRFNKDPEEIMCPKDFPFPKVWVEEDKFSTDFSKRRTILEVYGYTQFICLLDNFAAIRATMGLKMPLPSGNAWVSIA